MSSNTHNSATSMAWSFDHVGELGDELTRDQMYSAWYALVARVEELKHRVMKEGIMSIGEDIIDPWDTMDEPLHQGKCIVCGTELDEHGYCTNVGCARCGKIGTAFPSSTGV